MSATKKQFAEYGFSFKRVAKGLGADWRDKASALEVVESGYKAAREDSSLSHLALLNSFEALMLHGLGTHYFIDSEALGEWLPKTIKDYDPGFLDGFTDEFCGVVHTTGKHPRAILFGFTPSKSVFFAADEKRTRTFNPADGVKMAGCELCDLPFALALYIQEYPHAVHVGLPEFVKHPAHYKGRECAAVGATAEITERSGMEPHLRCAHWRYFRSEYFTKMRGKRTLIFATEVNGYKAKIVLDERQAA